jgi:hypothetical protein
MKVPSLKIGRARKLELTLALAVQVHMILREGWTMRTPMEFLKNQKQKGAVG